MNKIAQGLIGATAAILLLAGCSAVSAEAQDAPSATPSATTSASSVPTLTAEPTTADADFAESLHRIDGLSNAEVKTAIPVAKDVCAKLDSGTAPGDIKPIGNGTAAANFDFVFVSAAIYCPAHQDSVDTALVAARKAGLFG